MSDFLVDAKTGEYFWRDDLIKKHGRKGLFALIADGTYIHEEQHIKRGEWKPPKITPLPPDSPEYKTIIGENAQLKERVILLNKKIEREYIKRGKQVLKAEFDRAFSESDWWENFLHFCPEYKNKYFDRLHCMQYCRSYKGRTALEWKTYWEQRVERILNYRRNFNKKYVNNNLHKNAKNQLPI